MSRIYRLGTISALICLAAHGVAAQDHTPEKPAFMPPTLNTFGQTGLIEMPSAESQPDGELTTTFSHFKGGTRATLTFQITPRLSGSFRYSKINDFFTTGNPNLFDRSFDIRYRFLDETRYLPAMTIGLQDFIGTGVYGGEYIVATKHLHPTLKATLGAGWGRLGGAAGFTGRNVNVGNGGEPDPGNWFRGTPEVFGGLEWQTPIKGLRVKAEYSSDAYVPESITRNIIQRKSQFNFGLDYAISPSTRLSAHYLYGSEVGVQLSFALNPKRSPIPSGQEGAALPVTVRPALQPGQSYDTKWANASNRNQTYTTMVRTVLELQGMRLEALQLEADTARVYIRNDTYNYPAEAIGRAARGLTLALPPSVQVFEITPVVNGVTTSTVTFSRADLEALEHDPDGSQKLLGRSTITSAAAIPEGADYVDKLYPDFTWSLRPYLRGSLFDPDDPVRVDVGLRLRGRYDFAPGFSLSGSIIKPLAGNLDNVQRPSNSVLPRVRSDAALYYQQGDPVLERLTADYVFKLRPDVYGRVSLGYLETMFGGISTEVLWKPSQSRYALGAELNYVKQRDFDQRLGFQDYSVVTGHVSAYADLSNGFTAQVDAGRYLAGDWGATFGLNRTFGNGWKIGAFFTLTDVPFSQFGEGSFDKGITLAIPLEAVTGKPTRQIVDASIHPLSRDGGARLRVSNRLYPMVKGYDRPTIEKSFGRVWR